MKVSLNLVHCTEGCTVRREVDPFSDRGPEVTVGTELKFLKNGIVSPCFPNFIG